MVSTVKFLSRGVCYTSEDFDTTAKGLLMRLNRTGHVKIPGKVLRLSANIIAPSLTYIHNLLLGTAICVGECMETCASNPNLQI